MEGIPRELNKENYWTMIVLTENKDSRNLFTVFIRFMFIVIFQSSKLERVRKRTHTKTRWNRARDVAGPPITLTLLPFLSWYSKKIGRSWKGPIWSTRDPSPVTFSSPPSPPLKIGIVNGKTKLQNQESNTFISFFIDLLTNVSRIYSSLNWTVQFSCNFEYPSGPFGICK